MPDVSAANVSSYAYNVFHTRPSRIGGTIGQVNTKLRQARSPRIADGK